MSLPLPACTGYRGWAELLKRTFDQDVLECPSCSGRMKLVALVTEPKSIVRYLAMLGEPIDVPERSIDEPRATLLEGLCSALRCFLRFLLVTGRIRRDLAACVVATAAWRAAGFSSARPGYSVPCLHYGTACGTMRECGSWPSIRMFSSPQFGLVAGHHLKSCLESERAFSTLRCRCRWCSSTKTPYCVTRRRLALARAT
jgi:hypothetical protein